MEIQSGVLIETVYYYGSLVDNGEIPIEDVGDFTQQVFYTIDSLTPCHEYIGIVGGTIIASGGVEYFRNNSQKKPHIVHLWDEFCLNIRLYRCK